MMGIAIRPNAVALAASLVLVASVSVALDPPERTADVAIDDIPDEATPDDGATSARPASEAATARARATAPAETTSAVATDQSAGGSDVPADEPPPGTATPTEEETTPAPRQSTPAPKRKAAGPREADLYSDEAKVVGITDEVIRLCGHAALTLGSAFDTREQDLNVYWEMVNDSGGIHGRRVEMEWEDDAYSPNQAVTAAETCRSRDPFLLLGGIGFDQIPAVRNWAEQNEMLYLHHIATEPAEASTYAFTLSPSVELTGKAFGEHIGSTYGDRRIGILYRQSENWAPGRAAGVAELKRRGVEPVADLPVNNGQGVYSQQIAELQRKEADVVWIWENALNAAQIIQQSANQGYRPRWVVFPFQTTLDVLSDDAVDEPIDGVATWPSYAPGGYGGAFPKWGFDAEIARFEEAYREYRPGVRPNDILWQVWVGNRVLHRMFEACGPDCNRNRFAGMMLDGYQDQVDPACPVDFADRRSRGGHAGAFSFFAQRTSERDSGLVWGTTRYCAPTLG